MKKVLIYGAAIAAIAGCSAKSTDEVKVFDASCEKVVVFDRGDMIVKCPISETLASLQDQAPTGQFVTWGDVNFMGAVADAEHVYVNVIPAGAYEWAAQKEYRIMVKDPVIEDENSLYTVSVLIQE